MDTPRAHLSAHAERPRPRRRGAGAGAGEAGRGGGEAGRGRHRDDGVVVLPAGVEVVMVRQHHVLPRAARPSAAARGRTPRAAR